MLLEGLINSSILERTIAVMCGRYYIDDNTAEEIQNLVKQVDQKISEKSSKQADIFPSSLAPILIKGQTVSETDHFILQVQTWGFPGFNGQRVIFNARSESVLQKRMFSKAVRQERCIIPAKGFYEWDSSKNKFFIQRKDDTVLFMAGFYHLFNGEERFIILTTKANISVSGIHERMPLILEQEELKSWLFNDSCVENFLQKAPVLLKAESEAQQLTLDL